MTLARNTTQIVEFALTLAGVKADGESPSASETQITTEALNDLVKSWQATGAHLWSRRSATLFFQPDQRKYSLGNNTVDHATEDYTETTLSANMSSGSNLPSLNSSTGIAVGDNIGIELDSGSLFWSTVTVASPVTINDNITGDATSGNRVYYYTTDLGKALRIPDGRREQKKKGATEAQETEMIQMARIDYLNLPNKQTSGTPTQFHYNPNINDGDLFFWPVPENLDVKFNFTYYRPLDIFDNASDDADFPDEWIPALKYNLAVRVAPLFGLSVSPEVASIAQSTLDSALTWDQGDEPVYFEFSPFRWS